MMSVLFRSIAHSARYEMPTFWRWRWLVLMLYVAYVVWVVRMALLRRAELQGTDAMIATCPAVVFWFISAVVCVVPAIMFGLPVWARTAREIRHS